MNTAASASSEDRASNAHSENVGMGAGPLGVGVDVAGVTGAVAVEAAPMPLALLARTVKV